jgi:hypothetical protein
LFVAGLRGELEPNEVATVGHVGHGSYQDSLPRGLPVGISP